jgi:capsule polysaccharide export protein KpsE/RkpR
MMEEQLPNKSVTAEAEVQPANWVVNTSVLWNRRDALARVAVIAFVVSLAIALLIPKQYESSARIMPPESSSASSAAFAALAGRALGELGGLNVLAGSLLGTRNTSALYVDLLRSGTIIGHLIDRFELQHVYHKRYRIDTAKYLARRTTVIDDKKSGVLTITVQDSDPRRARDLTQGYLDELNLLVNKTSTSSAHQERIFIERRLNSVEADLGRAQQEMSDFSSTHTTIDLKEQTRAMVESAASLQAQLIVAQSEIGSLKQIYGDSNVRIRAAQARAADLQHELKRMSGTSAPLKPETGTATGIASANEKNEELYPPLRQLPRLAVPYANLYRRVRVQEAVYELLTQQYEVARIQEAKDVPVVSVIDAPGIPEKKSFPPRALLTLLLTAFVVSVAAAQILMLHHWRQVSATDPRRELAKHIAFDLRGHLQRYILRTGGTR